MFLKQKTSTCGEGEGQMLLKESARHGQMWWERGCLFSMGAFLNISQPDRGVTGGWGGQQWAWTELDGS